LDQIGSTGGWSIIAQMLVEIEQAVEKELEQWQ
jgi:hypothetical protein